MVDEDFLCQLSVSCRKRSERFWGEGLLIRVFETWALSFVLGMWILIAFERIIVEMRSFGDCFE